jgi:hypothetical protein
MTGKWIVNVFGDVDGDTWEVSVVREDNFHGLRSWGWFDANKLLVSHNGGPCHWRLAPGLGKTMVDMAAAYCVVLNAKERGSAGRT